MKRNSRSLIMYCISRSQKLSRGEIVELTGLSRAHVCGVVDELIAEGELIETGSVSVGRGRPTVLLEINPDSVSAAGVWLAEDLIEVGVAGATGDILARDSLSYSGDPAKDMDAIAQAIQMCALQAGKSIETMRGVGIVVAGLVNSNLGLICYTTHDNGFEGVPIGKLFNEKIGLPVFVDTDIRAAALADQWYGDKNERVLYISFCDGVGAAFVNERELFGSAHGEAPGVGHITIDRNGPLCECGKRGCLQAYTSNHTLIRSLWPDVDPKKLAPQELRDMVKKAVDLAAQGDYDAVSKISEIAEYIGLGISIAVNMLDPQTVYVAGTLLDCIPDVMMNMIRREAMPRITHVFQGVEIKPLTHLQEFEFKGAFGLVLLNQFRSINQDINTKFMFPYASKDSTSAVERYRPMINS